MKIINLQADNYKRIKAIEIEPDGSLVLVTGRNAQGKTSVLDAIWAALEGGDASRVTKQPIREGESHASVRLDLGEYIVTRHWKKNDVGTLTVESPRGARYQSPQKILDDLVGSLSMDPMAFIKQKPSEQVATLVAMLGDSLGFDPAELEASRVEEFEARRVANLEVKRLEAQLAEYPPLPADAPMEHVSIKDLLVELQAASDDLVKRDEVASDVREWQEQIAAEEARHKKEMEALQHNLAESLKEAAAFGPNDVDVEEIKARLGSAEETNLSITANIRQRELEESLAAAKAAAKLHDDELAAIAKQKADGLAQAKFPLEGLSFGDDVVTYNGQPLAQASGAEKRTVGLALAMASNSELRVIRIDEGESLDAEGIAHIMSMAEEKDYQVWMSRVDESGTVGVVIEDGMVKA